MRVNFSCSLQSRLAADIQAADRQRQVQDHKIQVLRDTKLQLEDRVKAETQRKRSFLS